jgi:hypothetical protein
MSIIPTTESVESHLNETETESVAPENKVFPNRLESGDNYNVLNGALWLSTQIKNQSPASGGQAAKWNRELRKLQQKAAAKFRLESDAGFPQYKKEYPVPESVPHEEVSDAELEQLRIPTGVYDSVLFVPEGFQIPPEVYAEVFGNKPFQTAKTAKENDKTLLKSDEFRTADLLMDLPGVGATVAKNLKAAGFHTPEQVLGATADELSAVPRVGPSHLEKWGVEEDTDGGFEFENPEPEPEPESEPEDDEELCGAPTKKGGECGWKKSECPWHQDNDEEPESEPEPEPEPEKNTADDAKTAALTALAEQMAVMNETLSAALQD